MDIRETIIDLKVNQKLSLRDIAKHCGLSHELVRTFLRDEGIDTKRAPQQRSKNPIVIDPSIVDPQMDVRATIADLRVNHKLPLRTIALHCGLSHERVRNILQEDGIDTKRVPKRPYKQTVIVEYNLDPERIESIYGCSLDEVRKIQKGIWLSAPQSPARLYNLHRKRYQVSPGWQLTLPQWWALWRRYWKHRDTKNLVMVPEDPDRPLSTDNAKIITRKQLMELYWERKHGEQS